MDTCIITAGVSKPKYFLWFSLADSDIANDIVWSSCMLLVCCSAVGSELCWKTHEFQGRATACPINIFCHWLFTLDVWYVAIRSGIFCRHISQIYSSAGCFIAIIFSGHVHQAQIRLNEESLRTFRALRLRNSADHFQRLEQVISIRQHRHGQGFAEIHGVQRAARKSHQPGHYRGKHALGWLDRVLCVAWYLNRHRGVSCSSWQARLGEVPASSRCALTVQLRLLLGGNAHARSDTSRRVPSAVAADRWLAKDWPRLGPGHKQASELTLRELIVETSIWAMCRIRFLSGWLKFARWGW